MIRNRIDYKSIVILLGLLLGSDYQMFSQSSTEDTLVLKSYTDKLAISIDFSTDIEEYIIGSDGGTDLHLTSNNEVKLSVTLNYEYINFSYGFAPNFLPGNDDDEAKGKSSFVDYRFNLFPGRFVQGLYYRTMKGFYVLNTDDFLPDWNVTTDNYFQFPDLRATSYGGSTGYVLNPKFSIRGALNQQELQLQSVGSFVPKLSYDFTRLTNTSDGVFNKEKQFSVYGGGTYLYNWVITEKLVTTPYIDAGLGYRFYKYTSDNEVENDGYLVFKYGGGIQLGYSTDGFFMGASGSFKGISYTSIDDGKVTKDNWFAIAYFGYRFDPPGFLSKMFGKTSD